MDFRIDVKGIDDIQKTLKELDNSVDPNTFNEWAAIPPGIQQTLKYEASA
jgi:hypothetical protein